MKTIGYFLLCWALITSSALADSYSITVPAGGYAVTANQLNNPNNTLDDILGAAPGINLLQWNCQVQGFSTYYYKTTGLGGTGWRSTSSSSNPVGHTIRLLPGQGQIFQNKTSTNYTVVFTGTANSPVYPVSNFCNSADCSKYSLLSGQTNAQATYEDITGAAPPERVQLFRYNSGSPAIPLPPNYTVYTYLAGVWIPNTRLANVGEPVWIKNYCSSCLVLSCPTNFTVAYGSVWDFGTPSVTNTCGTTNVTSVSVTVTNGTCPTTITRTWLFTDEYNDTSICSQTVTIVSADAPDYNTWAQHYGLGEVAPPTADPDGDHMMNMIEFLAGFDPTNNAAALRIISIEKSGDDICVTYLGANGDTTYPNGPECRTNVLEYTAGAANGSCSNNFVSTGVTNILSCGIGRGVVTNMVEVGGAANNPSRFYRVRVIVP